MFLDDVLYKLTYLLTYNILTFAPLELNPKFGGEAGQGIEQTVPTLA